MGATLLVAVTTHARAASCQRLLQQLDASITQAGLASRVFVLVLRDTSQHDYGAVTALLEERFAGRFALYESTAWLGKPGRYVSYQAAFDVVRALNPEHSIFLEDDVAIAPDFVDRSLKGFDAIQDANKAALYLCRFDDDEPNGRWVSYRRRPGPVASVARTQWLDLHAFVVNRRFFEVLRWRLFQPFPTRWDRHPSRSSGVSEQMTRRMLGRATIYQVNDTLAFHGREPSLLNVEARTARPLNNFPAHAVQAPVGLGLS